MASVIESRTGASADAETVDCEPRDLVARAARYLPLQGPLEVFVYRNSLHAFEDRPFHEALKAAYARYRGEPYLPESEYRRFYKEGRITDHDVQAAISDDPSSHLADSGRMWAREEIRYAMLRHPLHVGSDTELRWVIAETDVLTRFGESTTEVNRVRIKSAARKLIQTAAVPPELSDDFARLVAGHRGSYAAWSDSQWEAFSLELLWRICLWGAGFSTATLVPSRPLSLRDLILQATGEDVDRRTSDLLIRFCGAYIDQGYSDWLLPDREKGFFECFAALYSRPSLMLDCWLRRLPKEMETLRREGISAEESIVRSFEDLGILPDDREEFVIQTLLGFRGWAGMIWQLESGVDWVVHPIPKGSLVGLVAVQLILLKHAVLDLAGRSRGGASIAEFLESSRRELPAGQSPNQERRAFRLYEVAQILGWTPLELLALTPEEWQALNHEIESFSGLERRRVFHEAYERRYRQSALDAFAAQTAAWRQNRAESKNRPRFQIVTCIDDREESLRRHLEEIEPACETFGAAGFFAVAMYYRGAAEGFYRPLCPDVVIPRHYVREDVGYTFEGQHQSRAERRKQLGLAAHAFHQRSRTFAGGVVAGIVGSLATAPLIARVLFPHLTARIRRRVGRLLDPPAVTQLQLERFADPPGPENGHIGYSIEEMADVVLRLLQDIGLTESTEFSRLFLVCGHGSSSLNNPFESAYCCGACAGKKGGPNARAFAQMANDWRVRTALAERGIRIPNDTVFLGIYHDTCDDSVVFYDLDRLPASHRDDLEAARQSIEEARRRTAHERCRRFSSIPLDLSFRRALRYVEERSQDISQARPEYKTNSLCVVGRRDWSRGLFLDRRAFLVSYDPRLDDPSYSVLQRILAAAIPVSAGTNLEYYFSTVDNVRYGSGSKLPHNVVSLLGVMEGTSSDLRTGLYQQMTEIHEPMRITFLIESSPEAMLEILEKDARIGRLVRGEWVHLAVIDPETSIIQVYRRGAFQPQRIENRNLPEQPSSLDCYRN